MLAVGEPQVVVRDGVFHVARVVRSRGVDAVLQPPTSGKPWRLGSRVGQVGRGFGHESEVGKGERNGNFNAG